MTREALREDILKLIERQLELRCRRAHTSHGVPSIRVFADGREFLILVGERPTLGTPNPYELADVLAPRPGEIEEGRECTPEEVAELERAEEW